MMRQERYDELKASLQREARNAALEEAAAMVERRFPHAVEEADAIRELKEG